MNTLQNFSKQALLAAFFTAMLAFLLAQTITAQSYCESDGGDGYPNIESIEFGDIYNYTGDNDGYGDFTSQSTSLSSGDTQDIVLNPGGPWWIQFRWSIWIDFNQDFQFSDDELVVQRKGYGYEYDAISIPEGTPSGSTVMRIAMNAYSYADSCGDYYYGETEDYTINIEGDCDADAGTLTVNEADICFDGPVAVSASPNGDINVPEGYSSIYVLTQGEGLTIINAGAEPSFEVTEPGLYTIHTLVYDAETLDLGIVELGVTTGVDVLGLIVPGGGSICADLDVAGAPVYVNAPSAGTLTADMDEACLSGTAMISATPNGDISIPMGYSSVYVLTQGEGLTIVNAGGEPSFEVSEPGLYTIHTLVYDAETLDLGIVELGVTTGVDVYGLIVPGGGAICADLDVAGAPVNVIECACSPDAGSLTADMSEVCFNGSTTISATPNDDQFVPDGYSSIYVLTQGEGLTIVNSGGEPSFEVMEPGLYTIHTLVYDAETLDLGIVELGVTTGVDVLGLIIPGGGDICADLDVAGAPIFVENPDAGTLYAEEWLTCYDAAYPASLVASIDEEPIVPEGYELLYVLTQGWNLTIVDVSPEPSFTANQFGVFRIHTLVYNPATLDLSIVELGQTTGFDVNGLLVQGGGDICAALDVPGALFFVGPQWLCDLLNGFYRDVTPEDAPVLEAMMVAGEEGALAEAEQGFGIAALSVDVFPNPVVNNINVTFDSMEDSQLILEVIDQMGRIVISGEGYFAVKGVSQTELPMSELESGLYNLVVRKGELVQNVRFVKQ